MKRGFLLHKTFGFTLIELLVVISIISLLSSIVFTSLNSARDNSYDAVRKQDLKSIELALENFFIKNGDYPPLGHSGGWCTNISHPSYQGSGMPAIVLREFFPDGLPKDPKYADTGKDYFYSKDSPTSYRLLAELDSEDATSDSISSCARIGNEPNEFDYEVRKT